MAGIEPAASAFQARLSTNDLHPDGVPSGVEPPLLLSSSCSSVRIAHRELGNICLTGESRTRTACSRNTRPTVRPRPDICRDRQIRTADLSSPRRALFQAEPYPVLLFCVTSASLSGALAAATPGCAGSAWARPISCRRVSCGGSACLMFVPAQGLEPRLLGSEPSVLPLDYAGILVLSTGFEPIYARLGNVDTIPCVTRATSTRRRN